MRVAVVCQGEEMVVSGSVAAAHTWVREHGYRILYYTGEATGRYDLHVLPARTAEILERVVDAQNKESAHEL